MVGGLVNNKRTQFEKKQLQPEALSHHLHGKIKENHKKPQSR
jgi:hypothetical protein